MSDLKPMRVTYHHENPGLWTGNVIWKPAHRMRNGRFPPTHPAAPSGRFDHQSDGQIGASDAMNAFRAKGYWASCFPEGDGITLRCLNGQDASQVAKDIEQTFGWRVKVLRG